jgi:hypothetical protein
LAFLSVFLLTVSIYIPIILQYNITILTIVLQLPTVFSTVTCCTGLYPRSNRLYHLGLCKYTP